MDEHQRRLLDNIDLRTIDFLKVSRYLQSEGLISKEKLEDITRRYDAPYVRNLKLIDELKENKSEGVFTKIMDILDDNSKDKYVSANTSAMSSSSSKPPSKFSQRTSSARKIFDKLWNKFGDSSQPKPLGLLNDEMQTEVDSNNKVERFTSSGSLDDPVVCWHPYVSSGENSPTYISSSESDTSSDSLVIDSNITMAIARATNVMSVKTATICHTNFNEDYKMTADPRGLCLIVNNINFENNLLAERKGSDEDARRFDDIFQQLGFKVIMSRNLTADQMRQQFKDVANACRREHDALFVFILSHGSEHGIYGTDVMEVNLEDDIISCFDNYNCKKMQGKPKVFVLQACRGTAADIGVGGDALDSITMSDSIPASKVKKATDNLLAASLRFGSKKQSCPIRTDMLLIFSCLAGFVSVRNELAGSWLGVALAYFIMTHAHEKDLIRILNLVTSDVIQRESSNGHFQSIEVKLLGWTKNLYFNPGHPKPSLLRTEQRL